MVAPRRLTIAQMRALRRRLRDGKEDLMTYLDPANDNCAVPAGAREASAGYLDSWVLGPINDALRTLDLMLADFPEEN